MNPKMMNLLAVLILLGGGYFVVYPKFAPLPDDYEPEPETATPAAVQAQPPTAQPQTAAAPTAASPAGTPAAQLVAAPAASAVTPDGAAPGATAQTGAVSAVTMTTGEGGAVFPTLATGDMPAEVQTFKAGAAVATAGTSATPSFSGGASSAATPVPAFPGGGAAAPAPAFPGGGAFGQSTISLQQLQAKDIVPLLPFNAQGTYMTARETAEKGNDLLPMRSWLSLWRNQLRDPTRAMVELDVVKLLTQMRPATGSQRSGGDRVAREGLLREAKGILQAIRVRRVSDSGIPELVAKADEEVDKALVSLVKQR